MNKFSLVLLDVTVKQSNRQEIERPTLRGLFNKQIILNST